jgi:uncharacterized protein (TIGR02145 family)
MKKMIFVLNLIIIFTVDMMGQKPAIKLTFTAAKANTSEYVQLDSIRVTNISQDVDTVLFFPDTVLVLDYATGIDGNNKKNEGFRVIQNSPNPVSDKTMVSIFVPGKDNVEIFVTDVRGRSLLRSKLLLDRGYHSFSFTPGERGVFFLTASWRGNNNTIKILSEVKVNQRNELVYSGFNGIGLNLKSNGEARGFEFTPGDSLLYIGYANTPEGINGSDVLSDKPQSDETYLFEIIEGIPCPGAPAVNYGGQIYATVQIGNQCWFKENLNVGLMIQSGMNSSNNAVTEKYCYDNLETNCNVYGGLYQWDEMMQYSTTSGIQGICPPAWHLPTIDELMTLTDSLGGLDVAGGKMKETGTIHWNSPNTGATNSSGFTTLPSGYYGIPGYTFYLLGKYAILWSSNQSDFDSAWNCWLAYNSNSANKNGTYLKSLAHSVRCHKN